MEKIKYPMKAETERNAPKRPAYLVTRTKVSRWEWRRDKSAEEVWERASKADEWSASWSALLGSCDGAWETEFIKFLDMKNMTQIKWRITIPSKEKLKGLPWSPKERHRDNRRIIKRSLPSPQKTLLTQTNLNKSHFLPLLQTEKY